MKPTADLIFTVLIYGVTLRVLDCEGQRWLCGHDLAAVFEYRDRNSVSQAYTRGKRTLEADSIKAYIGDSPRSVRQFNERAVRYLCAYSNRPGSFHLLRWLDAGGLHAAGPIDEPNRASTHDMPPDSNVALTRHSEADAPVNPAQPAPVEPERRPEPLRLVSSLPIPLQFNQELEKEKAYCRDLLKVLVRYSAAEEVEDLTNWIDARIDALLRERDCRGLNDARYDLYCKYWLQGGDV